ncbi:precoat protein [Chilli leaf curl Ahmedabad virus]|uniref:Protein V2 n=2 Tax=Chilli leaf curl Ahmedabad virus TaxID=2560378 RepID=A0A0N7CYF8_9GEMI|nr:precoat protein [Chilli leaf curl Ahmedabad virus-India [India/Ahmedabad/2014]]AKP16770.1 precoat protein [Chilli leaf curl Ahmedabad virus-India [India/Ahmedabad/2014]]QVX37076.1 precoat protein [Chilli leaf curl Ahmedabad virus]UUF95109.1 movement protein [Chilli leaf curl Ahmedabad virus]
MWDPLVNEFPETVHGFRCMLAIKYLQLVENTYSPDSLGYDLIRELISVIRAKNYVQASSRYDHFRARLEVSSTADLNQPIQQACCCPHCPRHKGKGMGQQAHQSEADVLQNVQKS